MDCLLICDREGNFYELFAECCSLKLPLLVRLTQKWRLKEKSQNEEKIFDALRAMEPAGEVEIRLSRNPLEKELLLWNISLANFN